MELICKYLAVAFLFYIVVWGFWRMFPVKYEHYSEKKLRDIATLDLSLVGAYDDKFRYSLYKVFEQIYQKLYCHKQLSFRQTMELLHEWEKHGTYDPEFKVHLLIDSVCDDLEKRWADYKSVHTDGKEPFNVNTESMELPEPGCVLRYNDYIDIDSLYAFYDNKVKENASG